MVYGLGDYTRQNISSLSGIGTIPTLLEAEYPKHPMGNIRRYPEPV